MARFLTLLLPLHLKGNRRIIALKVREEQREFKYLCAEQNTSSQHITRQEMEATEQEVKRFSISRLVLWSENPRDPLPDQRDSNENDRIIRRAIADEDGSWKLWSLLRSMGNRYDFSSLPTVVIRDGHPIVYDGNRRVILTIIKHTPKYLKLLSPGVRRKLEKFDVPKKLYCNVSSEALALESVDRKHSDSGSWKSIQQSLFQVKYMEESPSVLLLVNSLTDGAIQKNKMLNQHFVEDEVFTKGHLDSLGISIEDDCIKSPYTREELRDILSNIFKLIEEGEISTRNRFALGELPSLLSESIQALCSSKKDQPRVYTEKYTPIAPAPIKEEGREENASSPKKRTPRSKMYETPLFGGSLSLKEGPVNNLYREIEALDKLITKNVGKGLSEDAHIVTRMALRLLCETAWKELKMDNLEEYLKEYFDVAKARLCKPEKTLLSKNISDEDPKPLETHKQLLSWLQDSAHTYDESTSNYKQTVAISVLVGAILSCSHGKE